MKPRPSHEGQFRSPHGGGHPCSSELCFNKSGFLDYAEICLLSLLTKAASPRVCRPESPVLGAPSGLLRASALSSETLDLNQRLFATTFSFLPDMSAYVGRLWNDVVSDPAHRQTLSTLPDPAFGRTQGASNSRNADPPQDVPEAVRAWNVQYFMSGVQACYLYALYIFLSYLSGM